MRGIWIVLLAISLFTETVTPIFAAEAARFPLACSSNPPNDCVQFQYFWDRVSISNYYNCAFPTQAKVCWPPSSFIIKACKQSPQGLDFIVAHNTMASIFRKAYDAGEFTNAPGIMHAWEDLDAILIDPLFVISSQGMIKEDLRSLNINDAVSMAKILTKYTDDVNTLLKVLSPIAINILACTDLEKRIPTFTKTIMSKVMMLGGVWFADSAVNEPVGTSVVYEGPVDIHFLFHRQQCTDNASQPAVLVQGRSVGGKTFSKPLSIGATAVEVDGNSVHIVLVKSPSNWARYQCAAGSLQVRNP